MLKKKSPVFISVFDRTVSTSTFCVALVVHFTSLLPRQLQQLLTSIEELHDTLQQRTDPFVMDPPKITKRNSMLSSLPDPYLARRTTALLLRQLLLGVLTRVPQTDTIAVSSRSLPFPLLRVQVDH